MPSEEISNEEVHLKSLDRVQKYPIVNDSLVLAISYYQWLKSKNSVIDNTLCRAERTLKSLKDTTEPIVVKQLGFIDDAVNNQLERFEKKCPIILESSSTIVNLPSQVYHDKLEPTVKTIMWPVTKTLDTVSKTSNMAISVVGSSIQMVLPSKIVSEETTNYIIDKSEELLDKYLPDTGNSDDEATENKDIRSKVKRLSVKTQRRLYKKALEKIDLLHKSSLEKLDQIKTVIANLQNKKENLKTTIVEDYSIAIESIKNIPSNLSKHSELLKEALEYSKTVQILLSSSANSSMEYLLNTTINSLSYLNGNLLNLQNLISDFKPNFISSEVVTSTNNVLSEIRGGMDSLAANIKEYLKRRLHEEETNGSSEHSQSSETEESDFQNPNGCGKEYCGSDD